MDIRFKHPCTVYVSGPSQSGKSVFISNCLKHQDSVFDTPFDRVIWAHGHSQPLHNDLLETHPHLQMVEGLPEDMGDPGYFNPHQNNCIIIDDLLQEATKDPRVSNLFTVSSHHANLTVIFLTQNLFHKSPHNRTMSINCHYLICFGNPRDRSQISHLGKQMFPGKAHFVLSAFQQATSEPYGYLIFDCKPTCLEQYRVRSGILPNESPHSFIPRDGGI